MSLSWKPDTTAGRWTLRVFIAILAAGFVIMRSTDVPAVWVILFWACAAVVAIAYRPVEQARRRNPLDLRDPHERPDR